MKDEMKFESILRMLIKLGYYEMVCANNIHFDYEAFLLPSILVEAYFSVNNQRFACH